MLACHLANPVYGVLCDRYYVRIDHNLRRYRHINIKVDMSVKVSFHVSCIDNDNEWQWKYFI